MKKSVFALCLLGAGAVYGQTMNSSSTTTTTTSTYDSTNRANNNGSTMTSPTYNSNTSTTGTYDNSTGNANINTNGSMNSANSTMTTTTTTTDYNSDSKDRTGTRADGKQGRFGIYAGVNFSRFINEPIPDDAYRAGWQAGLYGRSGGTVFGQIGLEYRNSTSNLVRTGTGTTPGQVANEVRGKIDQHFLAIPAYVGLRIGGVAGLRIQAGAELASLVAIGSNNFQLGKDDLNRTILNGLVGAGINLGPLTLDAVYNHGFANVFDQGADTKRRILAVNLGFRF